MVLSDFLFAPISKRRRWVEELLCGNEFRFVAVWDFLGLTYLPPFEQTYSIHPLPPFHINKLTATVSKRSSPSFISNSKWISWPHVLVQETCSGRKFKICHGVIDKIFFITGKDLLPPAMCCLKLWVHFSAWCAIFFFFVCKTVVWKLFFKWVSDLEAFTQKVYILY